MKRIIYLIILPIITLIFASSCANQQPPGGGLEDKEQPKVKLINPINLSLNFQENVLSFEFDEYIDRRSFQQAFRIYPKIESEIEYDWSRKSVDVKFTKKLNVMKPNTTFVVLINSNLIDIHGNQLTSPLSFAFSTGNKIDSASINGKIVNNEKKIISLFCYRINDSNNIFDPSTQAADYITETSASGEFTFQYLSQGSYRIVAVDDEDKNELYTVDRENYGVIFKNIVLNESEKISGVNILMKYINESDSTIETNPVNYFKDSLNIVFSSIEKNSRIVQPQQSIFLFFNQYKPLRENFANSFSIKDEADYAPKLVFNWLSDSLIEIFPSDKFGFSKTYTISFPLRTLNDSVYNYHFRFKTVSPNSYGEMKGLIQKNSNENVFIKIISNDLKPVVTYSLTTTDSIFYFRNILESEYNLFAFLDLNSSGIYEYGKPYPFRFSAPFYIFPSSIRIRGGWTIDNVVINFSQ